MSVPQIAKKGVLAVFLCTGETVVNANRFEGELHALRCKRWTCPHCRLINRKRVIHLGKNGMPTAMLTLTVSSNHYDTPEEAARDMVRGLVMLRRRIKRRFGVDKLPFLCVFEAHKSGYPHMHLLIRAPFMSVKVLREMWEGITGSWNVNIWKIRTVGQAVFYATKYIGKDLHKFEGCKRWWRSHNYNCRDDELPERRRYSEHWMRYGADFHRFRTALVALQAKMEYLAPDRIAFRFETGPPVAPRDLARLAGSVFSGNRS